MKRTVLAVTAPRIGVVVAIAFLGLLAPAASGADKAAPKAASPSNADPPIRVLVPVTADPAPLKAPPPPSPADAIVAEASAMPPFASLPEGHVAPPPPPPPAKPAPNLVGGSEHVAGFFVVPPAPEQQKQIARSGQDYGLAYLFGDAERAKMFRMSRSVNTPADVCFSEAESSARGDDEDGADAAPPAPAWSSSGTSASTLQWRASEPQTAVRAIHSETLVAEAEGRASLRIVDAWVDPRTRGARLIGRSTLPLARIYAGPNGLELYAARDGSNVQIVVRTAGNADGSVLSTLARAERSLTMVLPDGNVAGTDCGHVRVMLKPSPGIAQMVTLQSVAFLHRTVTPGAPVVDEPKAETPDQVRRRPFQLAVSASQSTTDPRPVLSVAAAWIGRDLRDGS
jgi:hypothetical protein